MAKEHEEDVEVDDSPSLTDKVGKMMVGGIAGLIATHFAEKLYDVARLAWKAKRSV